MFFDRDQNARRQRQITYRNQLKGEIQLRNSKILSKNQRPSSNQPETFSLLKNIETQQENRKKRQQNFYSDLQNQIQIEKQQKKRRKQEEARKQFEQEEKIKRDLEMLRQRAEIEKLQQQKKKGPPKQQINNQTTSKKPNQANDSLKPNKRISLQQSRPLPSNSGIQSEQNFAQQNINQQNNFHSRLRTSESERDQNQLPIDTFQSNYESRKPYGLSSMPTYVNRVENEPFNFIPQKKYMNGYFQELLGQKKRFEQEAASISELNRILYQQKSRAGKIESRGLGELKKLQMMLDEKGANYMAGFSNSRSSNEFEPVRKITAPTFENSRVSTINPGWRKLD